MTEEHDNESMAYNVSPELAHMLETMTLEKLRDLYDDESLIIARFVEGRERRELAPPTDEEVIKIHQWWAKAMTDMHLIGLVLKGMVYVDYDPDGEIVFEASFKGREAVNQALGGTGMGSLPDLPTD